MMQQLEFRKVHLIEQLSNNCWIVMGEIRFELRFSDTLDPSILAIGDCVGILGGKLISEAQHAMECDWWVFEPDYLIDVSALAECFQYFSGTHLQVPNLYFLNRFRPKEWSIPLFTGNLANFFLDAILTQESLQFNQLFKETFASFPLEYMHLFPDDSSLIAFRNGAAKMHFANLQRVVAHEFPKLNPPLVADSTMLEPSFISPELGLQGRLDALALAERGCTIVELKSGKAPWPLSDLAAVAENHAFQSHMYRMIVNQVLNLKQEDTAVYVLYSGAEPGSNLRVVHNDNSSYGQVLSARNAIVYNEKKLAFPNDANELWDTIKKWGVLDRPDLQLPLYFQSKFDLHVTKLNALDERRRKYFLTFTKYISKEQWLAKMGNGTGRPGASGLWAAAGDDHVSSLGPAIIVENNIASAYPTLRFKIEEQSGQVFDFRAGDLCVLFPEHSDGFRVEKVQITKGVLRSEPDENGIFEVYFRHPQRVSSYFDADKRWMIRHDHIDIVHHAMHRELFAFCADEGINVSGLLAPAPTVSDYQTEEWVHEIEHPNQQSREALNDLISKAIAAPRQFLLVGPPGTGKTSMFLKHYVVADRREHNGHLLILAYTNRAVDEICGVLEELQIVGKEGYYRIGSRNTCEPKYHASLLVEISTQAENRAALKSNITGRKVVVCTVATAITRSELIDPKLFDTVIVDEASQVLEPMLVNLLGRVRKFVLIGDNKQLPAVSLQEREQTRIEDQVLKDLGFSYTTNSLFERLLSICEKENCGTLVHHGRMHPLLAGFISDKWYSGALISADKPHQLETHAMPGFLDDLSHRLIFIDIPASVTGKSKSNELEARAVVDFVNGLLEMGVDEANIGVVVPFRNQAALIRQLLQPIASRMLIVDTVERFQGSQRDHVLFCTTIQKREELSMLRELTQSNGQSVDRKLNVAYSRARKQFVLFGNSGALNGDVHYVDLMRYIHQVGKIIPCFKIKTT